MVDWREGNDKVSEGYEEKRDKEGGRRLRLCTGWVERPTLNRRATKSNDPKMQHEK